jgi:hypothetical protein
LLYYWPGRKTAAPDGKTARAAAAKPPGGLQMTVTRLILLGMVIFMVIFGLKVLLNRPRG